MPLLIGAVARLVQAAVEIEIDLLRGEGLTEQNAALAVGQIGDRRQRTAPMSVVGRRVIDQVENLSILSLEKFTMLLLPEAAGDQQARSTIYGGNMMVLRPTTRRLTRIG